MPVFDEWPAQSSERFQFPREATSGPPSDLSRGELTREPLPFPIPERLSDEPYPYPGPYPGRYPDETTLGSGEQNPVFAPTYAGPPEQAPSADVQPARPQYVFPRPYEIPYGDL